MHAFLSIRMLGREKSIDALLYILFLPAGMSSIRCGSATCSAHHDCTAAVTKTKVGLRTSSPTQCAVQYSMRTVLACMLCCRHCNKRLYCACSVCQTETEQLAWLEVLQATIESGK